MPRSVSSRSGTALETPVANTIASSAGRRAGCHAKKAVRADPCYRRSRTLRTIGRGAFGNERQFSGALHGVIVPVRRLSIFPSIHEYSMITVPQASIGHVLV